MIAIKAHYDGKVIVPDEPMDLPVGNVIVRIETTPELNGDAEEYVLLWIARNAVSDPDLPTDLAHQHDHYLYGTPKKED